MIEDGMVIGLGGGATVALLINELGKHPKKIQAVTPSKDTLECCIRHGIPVLPLELTDAIDLAFDGCDELDAELNALKSCGGIHVREKIVASMAEEYILLANEGKWHEQLIFSHPITLEVIPSAAAYVKRQLNAMGAEVAERRGCGKAGLLISDDGNYLLEAKFGPEKTGDNIGRLAQVLDQIPGVVGHSLFYQIAAKAIIAKNDGIEIVERQKRH